MEGNQETVLFDKIKKTGSVFNPFKIKRVRLLIERRSLRERKSISLNQKKKRKNLFRLFLPTKINKFRRENNTTEQFRDLFTTVAHLFLSPLTFLCRFNVLKNKVKLLDV